MDIIEEKKFKIRTNNNNEMELILRNYNNEELSITIFNNNEYELKKYELKCNLEEFQKNRFFKIFNNIEEIMKELENKIIKSIFIEEINYITIQINIGLTIIDEIILIIEEKEKNKDEIIKELNQKIKILENKLNEKENKLNDAENKIKLNEEKINNQTKEINDLNTILKINENKNNKNEIKEKENKKLKNFKIENINNIKNLKFNKGTIFCLKTLDDGRLAAGDSKSNLIIYNKQTFNPDIIINNNLGELWNFIQLKNKNIACSFDNYFTLKIIKIKNNNEYESVQIINNAHNNWISKIIELRNKNLIHFLLILALKYGN